MRIHKDQASGNPVPKGVVRGCGTLFFGIFAAAGLVFTVLMALGFVGSLKTYLWKETPCTIVESRRVETGVEKSESSGDGFVIRYRYSTQGKDRTSSKFSNGITQSREESDIERMLIEYPTGSLQRCYVNSSNPDQAVLQRASLWVFALGLLPLIFVAIGVGGIIRVWTVGEPRKEAIARKAAKKTQGAAGVLAGGVFALVGAGIFYGLTIHPSLQVLAARSWSEVPCKIVRSEVGKHRSSKGSTTYSVDVTYAYEVDDREYRSNRYQFMGGSSSGSNKKAQAVKRYPQGSTAQCFVNPKDPTEAVLDRGFSPFMLFGLLGLLFLGVGLAVLIGTVRSSSRAGPSLTRQPSPTLPGTPAVSDAAAVGPVELESASSPVGRVIGSFFVLLFWNGLTSVFVVMAVKSWMTKKPEIFLSIFITPFVLIGLGMIVFFFHSLFALWNPRIRLGVSSESVPLGGRLEARWSFRGRTSRIKRLRITLEGSEKAKYTRGTDTRTDSNVFARLPVVDTSDARQIAEGQAQLQIPAESMHSFHALRNQIVWSLKVEGEIPRFPDVAEEFPITILPRA